MKKRIIFYVGGYDPQSSERFFSHIQRQINQFEKVWQVNVSGSEPTIENESICLKKFTAGDNKTWQTQTDFYFLAVNDIVKGDYQKPFLLRLVHYIYAAFNYIFSGTMVQFAKTSWRYCLYFFYPLFAFFITCFLSLIVALIMNENFLLSLPIFLLVFWLIVRLVWQNFYIGKAMETWVFSHHYIYQRRPDINSRLDILAKKISEVVENETFDEMLFIGHSLGGAFLIDVLSRAQNTLEKMSHKNLTLVTIGCTILKVGLHEQAKWFRDCTKKLFSMSHISWVDYQNHLDIISFYKVDTAKKMQLVLGDDKNNNPRPLIKNVRFRHMLRANEYKQIRFKLFRIHYQFTYSAHQKNEYDFIAICLGPASLIKRALCGKHFNNNLREENE